MAYKKQGSISWYIDFKILWPFIFKTQAMKHEMPTAGTVLGCFPVRDEILNIFNESCLNQYKGWFWNTIFHLKRRVFFLKKNQSFAI